MNGEHRSSGARRRTIASSILLGCTIAAGAAAPDVPPSPWGPEDTLGAVNRLSPAKVLEAAELIRTGETYALGVVTGASTPAYPPRRYSITVLQPGSPTGEPRGANRATSNDDLLHTWMGIGSQLDGLGHMGADHVYYNGLTPAEFVSPTGLRKLGTHAIPPIVTRGVLLDMTAVFDSDPVAPGTAFNRAEIEAAMSAQAVRVEAGDVVLFHTGWQALAETDPGAFMAGQPGLGLEGARWLAAQGVVAVGVDNWGVEAVPHEDPSLVFPVHVELLARNGIYLLESMNTAELAADEGWEFLFVLGQPRFEGAVQAVINPVAIR
ncbi:MAG: cyclase family protein [Pseudomonadales bacterium]|jgi:kynurenine formamidase|nr:cyclase family protein [Pseudomonadales bacterium]